MLHRGHMLLSIAIMCVPFWLSAVFALSPAEVLKLKQSGVSEATIQMMLENEAAGRVPSDKIEQSYATDGIGSWQLRDGRTIHSTGDRRLPLDFPTNYPTPAPYSPYADPYIFVTPEAGHGPHGQHGRQGR